MGVKIQNRKIQLFWTLPLLLLKNNFQRTLRKSKISCKWKTQLGAYCNLLFFTKLIFWGSQKVVVSWTLRNITKLNYFTGYMYKARNHKSKTNFIVTSFPVKCVSYLGPQFVLFMQITTFSTYKTKTNLQVKAKKIVCITSKKSYSLVYYSLVFFLYMRNGFCSESEQSDQNKV